MTKPRRTKKEFTPYNDYEDRPFGIKWQTAFALPELTKSIAASQNEELRTVEELPQMSRKEMDIVLQDAFLKSKRISIQLNHRDHVDRLLDSIVGTFSGTADETYLYLEGKAIEWSTIRNIEIKNNKEQ